MRSLITVSGTFEVLGSSKSADRFIRREYARKLAEVAAQRQAALDMQVRLQNRVRSWVQTRLSGLPRVTAADLVLLDAAARKRAGKAGRRLAHGH